MVRRVLIGVFIFAAVGFGEVRDEARRAEVLAVAARGQVDEVWKVLDELFFCAHELRKADPALAWEVYQTAKAAGMPEQYHFSKDLVEALELAQDAPPFDVDQFLETYGLSEEDVDGSFYEVWELAEEASVGGRFGEPDQGLVFNLVIRGSRVPFELIKAVKAVHADYMAGRVRPFRLGDSILSGAGCWYLAWRKEQRAMADQQVPLQQMASLYPSVEFAELQHFYDMACIYFEATASSEEGHGCPGYEGWVISSVNSMKVSFVETLSKFLRGDVPELVSGSSDAEVSRLFDRLLSREDDQVFLESFDWGRPADVLHTHEVWGAYRDRFVEFMKKVRPDVDASVWRNWLNRRRIEKLTKFEKIIECTG